MNFFRKLFSPKPNSPAPADSSPVNSTPPADPASAAPADDQVATHDAYGRETRLSKTQWRDQVLLPRLTQLRDQPDALFPALAQALQLGFAADVLDHAAHLSATDPRPERGPVLHAAALILSGRAADALPLLEGLLARLGENADALARLGQARVALGDRDGSAEALWRALQADPNHDLALGLYQGLRREQGGEPAALAAFRQVADLPDAWRARLWLARDRLEQRDLAAALALYDEAFDRAPRPVPGDLLQQITGDLGNHAHLPELLRLAAPYYDPAKHGLPAGLNLVKAYHDLGQLDAARRLLDRLRSLGRADWAAHLSAFETELAKTRQATADAPKPGPVAVTLLAVEGPVWLPPDSPAAELYPAKADDAPLIAFIGGTAALPPPPADPRQAQLQADGPARFSRALPLALAEQVELVTPGYARTLVAWMTQPRPGFILGGAPWDDATAARHARSAEDPADYLVVVHLLATNRPLTVEVRLLRTIDAARLATFTIPCPAEDPGRVMPELAAAVLRTLAEHADLAVGEPSLPPPEHLTPYLIGLEQLLAIRTSPLAPDEDAARRERAILEARLRLCLELPSSLPARLLLAHTAHALRKTRPALFAEFRDRLQLLQQEHALPEPAQAVLARLLAA